MYVGPWQELQLSKLQRANVHRHAAPVTGPPNHSNSSSTHSATLKSIESTIVNSLDYAQARLLLDKLGPLLGGGGNNANLLPTLPVQTAINSNQPNPNGTFYDPFKATDGRQQNLRLTQNSLLEHNRSNDDKMLSWSIQPQLQVPSSSAAMSKFPPVYRVSPDDYGIASEVHRDSGRSVPAIVPPLSVRSSLSEPIHGRGEAGRPGYNSSSTRSSTDRQRRRGGSGNSSNQKGSSLTKELPRLTSQVLNKDELRQQQLRQQQLRQHQMQLLQSQQCYNSQNAMQLLRLERSTRKAQQLPRPDLSRFWGWKGDSDTAYSDSDTASAADAASSSGKKQTSKEDRIKAEKIAVVRKMQQLYISTGNADSSNPNPNPRGGYSRPHPPPSDIQKSPIRPVRQQVSPRGEARVADMDLTETDLAAIAKYFGSDFAVAVTTAPADDDARARSHVDRRSPVERSPEGLNRPIARPPPSSFSDDLPDDPSSLPSPLRHDELYAAAGDGLLNWSSNLHLDDDI